MFVEHLHNKKKDILLYLYLYLSLRIFLQLIQIRTHTPGVTDELWRFWHFPFFRSVRNESKLLLKNTHTHQVVQTCQSSYFVTFPHTTPETVGW